jgi:hypothetical protein
MTADTKLRSWSELFPDGRIIYYEGECPDEFAAEIKHEFKLDVTKDELWDDLLRDGSKRRAFHCPSELLDEIYGSGKYCLGS